MVFKKGSSKKKTKAKKPSGRAPNPRIKPVPTRPLTGEAPATPMPIPGLDNGGTD
jgi:hypothetical protein